MFFIYRHLHRNFIFAVIELSLIPYCYTSYYFLMRKRSSLVFIEAEEFYKIDGISKINAHLKQKVICQVPLNELTSLPEPML